LDVSFPRAGAVQALVKRDLLASRTYRLAVVLDVVFSFLTLVLYFFISRTFANATTRNLGGAPSYFAFAAVGVALGLIVQSAGARVANRVREERLTGTFETLVAQPITATELALGLVGFEFLFATIRAAAYVLLAALFLNLDVGGASWPGFALTVLSSGMAMSTVGIVLISGVVLLKRAEVLASLTGLGLAVLGGAYFPIAVLPDWLQRVANVLPSRFAYDGVRAALFRGQGWAGDVLILVLFSAGGLAVACSFFAAALQLAKKRGSISTY
jgi:ABC-2 type transport system permease protein